MTTSEAIKWLEDRSVTMPRVTMPRTRMAYDMALEALREKAAREKPKEEFAAMRDLLNSVTAERDAVVEDMRRILRDIHEPDKIYIHASKYMHPQEFAALKKAHDDGRLVELPIIAMIEQTLENGKFKNSAKAQAFNGRYAVVYSDKSKCSTPLIDICGSTPYRIDEAVNRMAALKEKEATHD